LPSTIAPTLCGLPHFPGLHTLTVFGGILHPLVRLR
jgi:hypothetical protein